MSPTIIHVGLHAVIAQLFQYLSQILVSTEALGGWSRQEGVLLAALSINLPPSIPFL